MFHSSKSSLSTLKDNKYTLTLKRANIPAPLFLRNALLISETTRQGFFHLDSGQFFSVNRLKVLLFFSKLFVQKIPIWQQCLAVTNFRKQFHGYKYEKRILQKLSFLVNFIFFPTKSSKPSFSFGKLAENLFRAEIIFQSMESISCCWRSTTHATNFNVGAMTK